MKRSEQILALLDKLEVDAILISNGYNMRYISGFTGATGYLLITKEKQFLLTDFRYTNQAMEECTEIEILELATKYDVLLNDLIHSEHIKTLAFEAKDLYYEDFMQLKKTLKVNQMIPIKDEINNLRSIKTESEIACIKKAVKIGDIAFSSILEYIKPGVTELEIAARLQYIMLTNGAEGLSFDTIVASGIHSSMPHASPTNKKIMKGDFVTMDFGCVYQGYCSDMTRTVVVGNASSRQKMIYQTVLKAQMKALDFIKAGYTGREVDAIARNFIENAGFQGCFGHGLGHSVGLYIHENPRLSQGEEGIIQENNVITVEPGIYINGLGGVRIEDLVVVTKDGHINLTNSEKSLIEI